MMQKTQHLFYLLQFESFQDTIRRFFFKFGENRLTILAYAVGVTLALILIFRFLARKK